MTRLLLITRAVVPLLLLAGTARADLLSVGTVSSNTITWNLTTSPTDSPTMTVPIFNATGTPTSTLGGWALCVELIPQAGAQGSLTVDLNSIARPSNYALNANGDSPSGNQLVSAVGNQPFVAMYASNNASNQSSTVPTSGDNLVTFSLTSSNAMVTPSGTFTIVAFNDSSNGYSNWTYGNQANPSDPLIGNDYAFTNIPASGSFPGSEQQFVLGTINVLAPAAVPEPGSLVLAGIAAAGYAGYGWRRKRRLAGEPQPSSDDPKPAA